MAITDLTGTTWYVPAGWTATAGYGTFGVTVIVNDIEGMCNSFAVGYYGMDYDTGGYVSSANGVSFWNAHNSSMTALKNSTALTIIITDGDDTTNPDLIAWLQANGTQLKVTDLTGTTWKLNDNVSFFGVTTFNIAGHANFKDSVFNGMFVGFRCYQQGNVKDEYDNETVIALGMPSEGFCGVVLPGIPYENNWRIIYCDYTEDFIDDENYPALRKNGSHAPTVIDTITITGGTDVTNTTLIAWLQENGTLTNTYTELEYLESTGTQYIDTGIKLTNNHSVEIDYQLTSSTQKRAGIFGNLMSDMSGRYGTILSPSNAYLEYGYGAGNVYYQVGLPDVNRHTFKQEKNKVYVDNSLIYTFAEAVFSINKSAFLCNFDFTNYVPAKAKYFSSKWWDGDVLVRDFIPVLDGNNVPCMFDKVSQTFFYNAGTGDFLYKVKETPTETISITYNGSTIATLEEGQTATLNCNGKKMASDIIISFGTAGTITYNGKKTAVQAGQTATLVCSGKKAVTDIVIVAKAEGGEQPLTDLTGTTWQVNEGWTATAGYGRFYDIEYMESGTANEDMSYGDIMTALFIGYDGPPNGSFENDEYDSFNTPIANSIITWMNASHYTSNETFKLKFIGGTDCTNADLIAWLQANATLQKVEEVEEMVMITGGYQFHENIDVATFPKEKVMVNFKSGANNNTDFNCMFVEDEMLYYGDYETAYFQSWYTNEHMRVVFPTQTVPKSFYDWITANAERMGTIGEGSYAFNDTLTGFPTDSANNMTESISITDKAGNSYPVISVETDGLWFYDSTEGASISMYTVGEGWNDTNAKIVTVEEMAYVTHAFTNWWTANTNVYDETNLNGEFELINMGLGNIAGIASAIKIYYSTNDGSTWTLFNELNNNLYGEGVGNITKKIQHYGYIKFKAVINSNYYWGVSIRASGALILSKSGKKGSLLEPETYTSSNVYIGRAENIDISAYIEDR